MGTNMIDFTKTLTHDGIAIVKVRGWLEDYSCPYFLGCMRDLVREGHQEIVIDCESLGLLSSSCLNSLLRARKQVREDSGQIVLANVNTSILEVIGFLGIKRLFGIHSTLEIALSKVRKKTQRQS